MDHLLDQIPKRQSDICECCCRCLFGRSWTLRVLPVVRFVSDQDLEAFCRWLRAHVARSVSPVGAFASEDDVGRSDVLPVGAGAVPSESAF
eukprot:11149888-Alexandrium_andersonii.AAC.1